MLTPNTPIGTSDLISTRIAYGCWRLVGSEGGPAISSEDGRRAVRAALTAGINFFDHADIYGKGRCEEIFGDVLRESPSLRDGLLIATKCGIRPPWDGAQHCYDSSREHIIRSVEKSLRSLCIDYIDLLMIHRPDYLGAPDEIVSAFAELHDAGKVRWFGVSNFKPSQVSALQSAMGAPILANQVEISLANQNCLDDGTLDQCLSSKITPLAWSPLAKGRLTGEPRSAQEASLFQILDSTALRHGVSRATIALAWLLKHPSRMIPIIGTTNPNRITEAIAAEKVQLSREEWYALLIAARGMPIP